MKTSKAYIKTEIKTLSLAGETAAASVLSAQTVAVTYAGLTSGTANADLATSASNRISCKFTLKTI